MEEDLQKRIKELEETVHILEKDLIHDGLTSLKTRAFFEEEARVYFDIAVNAALSARRRNWFGFKNVSFVFIDIDFFKKINDTYGHLAGDEVLKTVATAIKESVREGDTAARWGGEEFAVTLVGATERDAVMRAEDIRTKVEKLIFSTMPDLSVTASAGVASAEAGKTLEDILARADEALYKAKASGRNKVVAYSEL
jgi:diguanylate cyclase (GGDEF)-like protein